MSGPPDSVSTKWNRTWKGFRLGEVPVASLQLAQSSGHGVCWIKCGVTSSSLLKSRKHLITRSWLNGDASTVVKQETASRNYSAFFCGRTTISLPPPGGARLGNCSKRNDVAHL